MGVARVLVRGGTLLGVGLVGGRGRSLSEDEKFSKIFRGFLNKISKMHYFIIFFKMFNIQALNFRAFGRKTQIVWKF